MEIGELEREVAQLRAYLDAVRPLLQHMDRLLEMVDRANVTFPDDGLLYLDFRDPYGTSPHIPQHEMPFYPTVSEVSDAWKAIPRHLYDEDAGVLPSSADALAACAGLLDDTLSGRGCPHEYESWQGRVWYDAQWALRRSYGVRYVPDLLQLPQEIIDSGRDAAVATANNEALRSWGNYMDRCADEYLPPGDHRTARMDTTYTWRLHRDGQYHAHETDTTSDGRTDWPVAAVCRCTDLAIGKDPSYTGPSFPPAPSADPATDGGPWCPECWAIARPQGGDDEPGKRRV